MNTRRQGAVLLFTLIAMVTAVAVGPAPVRPALGLGAGAPAVSTAAQDTTAPAQCNELQVVFIADQSGSMTGYTDASGQYFPPTDPNNMRFSGMKTGVETLLYVHPSYQDVRFQVALIDFGDEPQVRLNWTDLNPTTEAERDAQITALAPTFNPSGSLGNTLPGKAIQQAASLFAQQDGVRPQVDGCPRRVVILLTDGLPFDDVPGFNWQTHLADTATYARQYLPYPNYRLYVIGLDQNGAFFDDAIDEWANVTGAPDQLFLATNPAQMAATVTEIIYDALSTTGDINITRGCAENGEIVVPPYTQLLRVLLFKPSDQSLHLEVVDPTGRALTDSLDDITITGQAGTVETLVATNPQPGIWRVLTQLPAGTEDKCLVNYMALPAVERVQEPADGARVTQFTNVPIVFQLVDEAGVPLPDYGEDRYDLQMRVEVRYAAGPTQTLSLGANPGQQYRGEALARYDGAAAVFVNATALDDRAQQFEIFDKTIATFEVDPVSFVAQELPPAGGRIGQHEQLPLSFTVIDSAGQPVALDAPVNVVLTHTVDGTAQAAPALTANGGEFAGTLTLSKAGAHSLAYTATVSLPAQGGLAAEEVELGSGQVAFEVFPVNLLRVEFDKDANGNAGGVATNPFLSASGMPLTVRLLDDQGAPVSPAATGAADPTQIFEVIIHDADGQVVLSGADKLTTTGQPGVFQLRDNPLGRGEYQVTVRPATTISESYTWEAAEWTTAAVGTINPLFYALVAGALAIVAVVALAARQQWSVRQHPLRGSITVYEQRWVPSPMHEDVMDIEKRVLFTQVLPNRNKVTLYPSNAGDITKIVITSPDANAEKARAAQAMIYRRKAKPTPLPLAPNDDRAIIGTNYYIVKDRSDRAADGSTTAELSSSFN